jgi:anthranilate synthase component 1
MVNKTTDTSVSTSAETVTSVSDFESVVDDLTYKARVPVEIRTTVHDPYEAYRNVRHDSNCVYLETTGGQEGWGYFAIDPDYWHTKSDTEKDGFNQLEDLLNEEQLIRGDCTVPYPCGAFGWLSYDLVRELENLPDTTEDDRSLPRFQFGIYDLVAAWKEPRNGENSRLRITCCPQVEPDDDVIECYESAHERAEDLVRRIHNGEPGMESTSADDPIIFRNEVGKAEYGNRVRTVKDHIYDGDTFQANISQRLVAPAAVHPVRVFDALRVVNPAPYSGLLEFPGVDLISTSPELLLQSEGDRLVTEPIAGTRPRGDTVEKDVVLEEELLESEKEEAEHAMLVDLERNDLGKVSEYGSVEVTDYRRIDRYSEVMHTVSVVEGSLRKDKSIADAIAAVFPGGTITGAPKPRTMEIIDKVESTRRGPYTGSIGILGFDDHATLNMTIRTLVRRHDQYYLRIGSGIVHDSEPEAEFYETIYKGNALINAVDEALGDGSNLEFESGRGLQ